MTELSVIISVQPMHPMRKDNYRFVSSDYFQLATLVNTAPAGDYFTCDQTINIDKPDKETCQDFSFTRSCIVTFTKTSGNSLEIGTSEIPAQVIISPNLNTAQLKIKCKMLTSPFI